MANEIEAIYSPSSTLYGIVFNGTKPWNNTTNAWETYNASNLASYVIPMSYVGSSLYSGNFPTAITAAGTYTATVYVQAGGSPAGSDQAVASGSIDWLGTAGTSLGALASLTYVKTFLNITNSTYDTILSQRITSASQAITGWLWGRQLAQATYATEYHDGRDNDWVRIYNPPLQSFASITFDADTSSPTTVASTEFLFDPDTGTIKFKPQSGSFRPFNRGFRNVVVNSYVGGFATIPTDVQDACSIIVGVSMFRYMKAGMGVQSKRVGDVQLNYFPPIDLDDPIFAEAKQLLEPYRIRRL